MASTRKLSRKVLKQAAAQLGSLGGKAKAKKTKLTRKAKSSAKKSNVIVRKVKAKKIVKKSRRKTKKKR